MGREICNPITIDINGIDELIETNCVTKPSSLEEFSQLDYDKFQLVLRWLNGVKLTEKSSWPGKYLLDYFSHANPVQIEVMASQ